MKLDGKKIADYIAKLLKKKAKKVIKKKPALIAFLVGNASDQQSFVKIKAKTARKLGFSFKLVQYKSTPFFEKFAHEIKRQNDQQNVHGIIIQQPLPAQLSTDTVYNYIDVEKEIEGHRHKSPFIPPVGLAVLTILKFVFSGEKLNDQILVDAKKDRVFFKRMMRSKKVVLIGRGITGGKPIGQTLTDFKINYIGINSKTPDADTYLKEADIVITAVGKKVINPENIKPGVILINVGLRRENGILKGDYDEKEIKNIASSYTPTPGGLGPIDVVYLFNNLIEAVPLQK